MAFEHHIAKRRHLGTTRVASRDDFVLERGDRVALSARYADPNDARLLSPYAIDIAEREVVFVETDADPADAHPFFYEAQRRLARRVVTASFDEVVGSAARLGTTRVRFASLFSAGRSGSTVAGAIANALPGVAALSEPDIFSNVTIARGRPDLVTDGDLVCVLRATARLLAAHREAIDPGRTTLLVKHRGMSMFTAALFRDALPDARALYLSRNPTDIVDSYVGAFLRHPVARLGRAMGLDRLAVHVLRRVLPHTHPWLPRAMPLVFAPPRADERDHGAVEVLALVLSAMRTEFTRLAATGDVRFAATLRYEDLRADAPRFVRTLADGLDIAIDEVDVVSALGAAREDAQMGTGIASLGRSSLSADDVARVKHTLARVEATMQSISMEAA